MKLIEYLPIILFVFAIVITVITTVVLVRMKNNDMTEIKDDTDYQNAERPFIDNL